MEQSKYNAILLILRYQATGFLFWGASVVAEMRFQCLLFPAYADNKGYEL